MNKKFLLSGLLLVIFFIIRIICKFIIDDDLDNFIINYTSFDNIEREIIENGLSLSLSFLSVGIIRNFYFKKFVMVKNPYLDFFSIIFGTIIMLILYKFYVKLGLTKINILRKDRDLDKDHVVDLSVS